MNCSCSCSYQASCDESV